VKKYVVAASYILLVIDLNFFLLLICVFMVINEGSRKSVRIKKLYPAQKIKTYHLCINNQSTNLKAFGFFSIALNLTFDLYELEANARHFYFVFFNILGFQCFCGFFFR